MLAHLRAALSFGRRHSRAAINWLGLTLGLAGAVLIGLQVWRARDSLAAAITDPGVLVVLAVACLAQGFSRGLVFFSWYSIINGVSVTKINLRTGVYISAIMNLLKYLPGNVAHHAWRTVFLHQRGVDIPANIWAGILATISMVMTSTALALLFGGPLIAAMFPRLSLPLTISLGLAVLVGGVGVIVLVFRSEKINGLVSRLAGFDAMKAFALSVVVQTGFFMINGTASYMLVSQVYPQAAVPFGVVMAAFAGGWIIGFLTPGAPAGMGVREAVIVLVLTSASTLGIGEASVIALLIRIATIVGDLIFAAPAIAFTRTEALSPDREKITER